MHLLLSVAQRGLPVTTFDNRPASPETVPDEHIAIRNLITAASQGQLVQPADENCLFYADPITQHILSASDSTLVLLGYTLAEMQQFTVADLETPIDTDTVEDSVFTESSIEQRIYSAVYRRHSGASLAVRVYRRLLPRDDTHILQFRLEDQSLTKRLWRELYRREGDGFEFQQRLKHLNEITIQLNPIDKESELYRQTIHLGMAKLGFDRLSLWLLDRENTLMVGTVGVDEHGQLRDEHQRHWSYQGTYVETFLAGKTEALFDYEEAPLYNSQSQVIDKGWHIAAPVLYDEQVMGVLTSDNYLRHQPMKHYEPELLRLFGSTVGHLLQLVRGRQQTFTMRMEQERSRVLRQFVADVGHDFRTPLAVINTKSYLITRVESPEQRQTLANQISEQVSYLATMLNSMLEFIALDTNLALTLETVDLPNLLRAVIAQHRLESAARAIEVGFDPANAAQVEADKPRLQRALSTILQNAIQYTGVGGRVEVSFVPYASGVGIVIEDNGIGMTAEALDSIFKLLHRGDEARTERRAGLGLSIARTIVEAHGGLIRVQSTPNVGSRFEIVLPHKVRN